MIFENICPRPKTTRDDQLNTAQRIWLPSWVTREYYEITPSPGESKHYLELGNAPILAITKFKPLTWPDEELFRSSRGFDTQLSNYLEKITQVSVKHCFCIAIVEPGNIWPCTNRLHSPSLSMYKSAHHREKRTFPMTGFSHSQDFRESSAGCRVGIS
jgi:hypothetical protein